MPLKKRQQRRRTTYDYVIIGSGSAGSVVASRLAEDTSKNVLLLEAGPWDNSIYLNMPAAFSFPLKNDRFNWFYYTEPEPYLNDRRIYEARGRVLGGSSCINGLNWVRGNGWDYDEWNKIVPGWAYADCLPYFKKAETFSGIQSAYRGASGPMRVETANPGHPINQAFLDAGVQYGLDRVSDHNAYKQEGVHVCQRNVGDGLRWTSSRAYLHEAPYKDNLDVVTEALVQKIVFSGKRATGIEYERRGTNVKVHIDGEVIVSGGSINSPQILMLSGVGSAKELKELGISLVADVPGVGKNLKDHTSLQLQYSTKGPVSVANELSLFGQAKLGVQWVLTKKGLGATNFFEVGAFFRTNETEKISNIQIEFIPLLGDMVHGTVKIGHGIQYYASLQRPESTGRVWLKDANPKSPPKFVFNHLQSAKDCADMVDAVRVVRNIVSQAAWDKYRDQEVGLGKSIQSDEEILSWLRKNVGTNYHPCCSCRMGTDDMSVTDGDARVHTLDNVRVIDASIMPRITTGNLNSPTIMMAEKLADKIRGRRLPAETLPYWTAGSKL